MAERPAHVVLIDTTPISLIKFYLENTATTTLTRSAPLHDILSFSTLKMNKSFALCVAFACTCDDVARIIIQV